MTEGVIYRPRLDRHDRAQPSLGLRDALRQAIGDGQGEWEPPKHCKFTFLLPYFLTVLLDLLATAAPAKSKLKNQCPAAAHVTSSVVET